MILHGNCLDEMKKLDDNSVDSIVTDPPYGLSFMGKSWDYEVPSTDIWKEAFRVLKPGGHLLSFFGTRTYHRGVVRIEDAGFEIRDQIMWIYGSGFPKSHNIGKAIDKINGDCPIVIGKGKSGVSPRAFQSEDKTTAGNYEITKANNEWQGWGTALKPANEPIVVARKPLKKGLTIAQNVLKYGTGALNIDESRIGFSENENIDFSKVQDGNIYGGNNTYGKATQKETTPLFKQTGRWPANILFDESAAEMLDEQSGTSKSSLRKPNGKKLYAGNSLLESETTDNTIRGVCDSGGASRFFYVAKASKRERNAGLEGMPKVLSGAISGKETRPDRPPNHTLRENHHPTVKPIKLMEYLIKLVTPPKGTVLDPFMGSGSTGVACKNLGFNFIGCEMNDEYIEIAKKRIG
jgi:DNA modification methylase